MKTDYANVSAGFDAIAADYATAYGPEGNTAMIWMRRENLALLRSVFPPGSHLLELGCGTGEEAVALAESGCTVLATDISPKMAGHVLRQAAQHRVLDRVAALALPAGSIGALRPTRPFDGAYASFGALNCEPDLIAVGAALARLVAPGGVFVTSIMGPVCLFEIVWYVLHAAPRRAFRRFRKGWQLVPVAGQEGREVRIPTRYLSVRQIVGALPEFQLERIAALPLFLPPPYAATLWHRYPRLIHRLERADRFLHDRQPWRALGDHTVLVLRRTTR